MLLSRATVLIASLTVACCALAPVVSTAVAASKQPTKKVRCHPSYKGACLDANASDYDCIGGRGNGPKYTGKVRVVGPDVFRLDADHDGWGCE